MSASASTPRREAIRLAAGRFPQVRFIHGLAPRDLGAIMDRARLVLLTDVLEHVPDDFRPVLRAAGRGAAGHVLPAHRAGRSDACGASTISRSATIAATTCSGSSRSGKACRSGRCSCRTSTRGSIRSSKLVRSWNRLRGRAAGRGRHRFRAAESRCVNSLLTRLLCRRTAPAGPAGQGRAARALSLGRQPDGAAPARSRARSSLARSRATCRCDRLRSGRRTGHGRALEPAIAASEPRASFPASASGRL